MAVINFATGSFADPVVSQAQAYIASQTVAATPQSTPGTSGKVVPISTVPASSGSSGLMLLAAIGAGVYWWYTHRKGHAV